MVVFMTDGEPTVGETSLEKVVANVDRENHRRARIFVFGVGDDVNTLLLDRLARDGDGVAEYVRPNEDLELKVSAFTSKIANPVLSDPKLDVSGVEITDVVLRLRGPLSRGEAEVLRLASDGYTNVRIAHELDISLSAVKARLEGSYANLRAADRTHAVAIALRQRWIQ